MENYDIYKWFTEQHPAIQSLYAGLFTWILTALGAALVFFFNSSNRKVLDCALGFTGGVMIAASFWSLLSPAISYVELQNNIGMSNMPEFLPPAIGFFLGALFLYILDTDNSKVAQAQLEITHILLVSIHGLETHAPRPQ